MKGKVLVISSIIVLGIIAISLVTKSGKEQSTQSGSTPLPTQSQEAIQRELQNLSIVALDANGFSPRALTLKRGTRVVWVNKSGAKAALNSDPHPAHSAHSFLNLGEFDNGSSVQVVFDTPGSYSYHNHKNPTQRGTIEVTN